MSGIAFGRFLELSLPTSDIRQSMDFYRRLGFSELPVGDIRRYHYGVVTDGRIAIGLHAGGIEEPALSFVHEDVAATVPPMMSAEDTLTFTRLGEEAFHEIGMRTPDDQLLIMMEARTFSRADLTSLPRPVIGHMTEISLGCRNQGPSIAFWTGAGMTTSQDMEENDDEPVELLAPGLRLGLHPDLKPGELRLNFRHDSPDEMLPALEKAGIPVRQSAGRHYLQSPEGVRFDLQVPDR